MKRQLAVLAAVCLAAAGAVALAVAPAGAAATGCRVDYTVTSQWSSGFTTAVTVTNLGAPVDGWTLGFSFTAGQQLTQGWNATWTQSGSRVSATSAAWNGSLATGGSATIGFNAWWSGSNPVPAPFTLNGIVCTGTVSTDSPSPSASVSSGTGGLPPVITLTSPNSTVVYGEPGTIRLAATASDPDGYVTKVEFSTAPYSGTPFTLVATDTTAPYEYLLTVPTVSVFVIRATAYDNSGLTATATVRILVGVMDPPPPSRSPSSR
jgi:hypothetical protein